MEPPRRLHHVGLVVARIEESVESLMEVLGATWNGQVFEDPLQGAKVAFLTTRAGDAQVELVEAASKDSPVERFLREKGGGLHHLCYEAADIEQELRDMRARGALLVKRPKPAVAFGGRRIAWVLTAEKLLIELLEAAPIEEDPGC